MQRLFEAGLTVLMLTTVVGFQTEATPGLANSTNSQPKVTQVQPKPQKEARQTEAVPVSVNAQVNTSENPELSERDRLILERRLQQIIPPVQPNN